MSELQLTRTIKVHSSLTDEIVEIQTAAKTWGELLPSISNFHKDMKATCLNLETKEKIALEYSSTKLPEKAIVFIMSGKKNDSGLYIDYNVLSYNELRRLIKLRNLGKIVGKNPQRSEMVNCLINNEIKIDDNQENHVEIKEQLITNQKQEIVEIKKEINFLNEIIRLKSLLFETLSNFKKASLEIKKEQEEVKVNINFSIEESKKEEPVKKVIIDESSLDLNINENISDDDIRDLANIM